MTQKELDEIEEKALWSGYDRSDGVKIILTLIEEIRNTPTFKATTDIKFSEMPYMTAADIEQYKRDILAVS